MQNMDRRTFMKGAGVVAAATVGASWLASCGKGESGGPYINTNQTFKYRMVTTWPPGFAVIGGGGQLAERIEQMSGGRLQIKVYDAGEKVGAMQAFDEVSMGNVEMAHSAPYYWAGKAPAAQFFAAVPFGMTAQQLNAWLHFGGGQELWDKVYADHNLIAFPAGNTGMQMGGWFNREINTPADFRQLVMRMPGLGGAVMRLAGATINLPPVTELYISLSTGVLDALEWVGPLHDHKMGFQKIAKFYYYPGWQEPGTNLELMINRAAWDKLPSDLQMIVRTAAGYGYVDILADLEHQNAIYLERMVKDEKVQLRRFPDEVLKELMKHTQEVLAELGSRDAHSRQVHDSYRTFHQRVGGWSSLSEATYYQVLEQIQTSGR